MLFSQFFSSASSTKLMVQLFYFFFSFLLFLFHHHRFTHHKTEFQKHPNGKINLVFFVLELWWRHKANARRGVRGSEKRHFQMWSMWVWVIDSMIRLAISFIKGIVIVITFIFIAKPRSIIFPIICFLFSVRKTFVICAKFVKVSSTSVANDIKLNFPASKKIWLMGRERPALALKCRELSDSFWNISHLSLDGAISF